jgi:hypothetical protein
MHSLRHCSWSGVERRESNEEKIESLEGEKKTRIEAVESLQLSYEEVFHPIVVD